MNSIMRFRNRKDSHGFCKLNAVLLSAAFAHTFLGQCLKPAKSGGCFTPIAEQMPAAAAPECLLTYYQFSAAHHPSDLTFGQIQTRDIVEYLLKLFAFL